MQMLNFCFQATKTDAPILVCASHSTFLDFVAVVATKSTVLISSEVLNPYGFAPIAKFLQFPIVSRSQKVSLKIYHQFYINFVHCTYVITGQIRSIEQNPRHHC